jgi:hypothetical protein
MRLLRSTLALPASLALAVAALSLAPAPTGADVPFPTCQGPACTDPTDYGSYLFLAPGQALPNDFGGGDAWKYQPTTGMNIVGAWQTTTGRPDVRSAILDSGIRWNNRDLAKKVWLNVGELPNPCAQVPPGVTGRLAYDCNGDAVVNVTDWAGAAVPDANGNGFLDAQDLIRRYSDGVDDDGNGYPDDVAGWDFQQSDNDANDEVDYGHGTGEGEDGVGEANNGTSFPGVAPSAMFVPLKVADSFIAVDTEFAQAVVYAVDIQVDVISEALGTVSGGPASQAAIDYAYRRGIPIIASAADEQSRHHNLPANLEHTIWVNSIRDVDGTFALPPTDPAQRYLTLNGCTNNGGRAWVAISSTACSSEATGRSGGLSLLLVSHGKNLIERGLFSPYPGLATPFSAEEFRQLFRRSAQDVDQSADLSLQIGILGMVIQNYLGAPPQFPFTTTNFPTQAGWDQFTGFGRPDATKLLDVSNDTMPPEADLSGSLLWFDTVDPVRTPSVAVKGSAAAVRTGGSFIYTVEVGCGIQPTSFTTIGSGSSLVALQKATLAMWNPAATAAACGFDPAARITGDPDSHSVQLRLLVQDSRGNVGEDRRTVAIDHDATQKFAPRWLGASGESSSALADVDRDGVLDIVQGTASGALHVLRGSDGSELPGFPVYTDALPVHLSPGFATGAVPIPHEAIVASIAADDLDGDGSVEIVAAGMKGQLYVWDAHGRRRAGFPVRTNPAYSASGTLDRFNDADRGIASAPTLADLDAPGVDPKLEIVFGGLDGFLYAFRANGAPVAGFPVRLADPAKVTVDPATGRATPKAGSNAQERLRKVLSSPAIGDLDGDGSPEIVIATNEEYSPDGPGFSADSTLFQTLLDASTQLGIDLGGFSTDTASRVYTVHADGNLHAGGPFRTGWPARVPLLLPGLLPTVATGTPGSPALADLDGNGSLAVAIFSGAGPVILLDADANPVLGSVGGAPRVLAIDFPGGGFPNVPATAGTGDAPFFGALGSGAFGDLTGDGLPEYVAPTGGVRALLDVGVAGSQEFGDHSITAWNPITGLVLPAFPRKMDDMQFLASPGIADVDGDGHAEVIQGSGAYLVHAFRADGSEPAGWPKFTHGWMIPAPTAGDVDGDGLIEVVSSSREGFLYVWDTPAPSTESAVQWQGFGRDRRNTKNMESGVLNTATAGDPIAGLRWALESIDLDLRARIAAAPASSPLRMVSGASLRFTIVALEQDRADVAAAMMRFVDYYLTQPLAAKPLLADLRARLVDALASATQRGVAAISCTAGDAACQADVAAASARVALGDQYAAQQLPSAAVLSYAKALAIVAKY